MLHCCIFRALLLFSEHASDSGGSGMATDKTVGEVFCKACKEGNVEKVRHCIALDVDVNWAKPQPGLIEASFYNHYQVVDMLLQQPGIDVNRRGGSSYATALYVACQENNIEIVRRLLRRADIDVNAAITGWTALHVAAAKGNVDCVKLLLDCSAMDVNKKTDFGVTAIVFAVQNNQRAVVELLMRDRRTDLKARNNNNETLVQIAVSRGFNDIAGLLLLHQYQNQTNNGGRPECPVCYHQFGPGEEIHQCYSGHIVCGTCRPNLQQCPTCRGQMVGRATAFEQHLSACNSV